MAYQTYTKEQEIWIINNAHKYTHDQLALVFNAVFETDRTAHGLRNKALNLGVKTKRVEMPQKKIERENKKNLDLSPINHEVAKQLRLIALATLDGEDLGDELSLIAKRSRIYSKQFGKIYNEVITGERSIGCD